MIESLKKTFLIRRLLQPNVSASVKDSTITSFLQFCVEKIKRVPIKTRLKKLTMGCLVVFIFKRIISGMKDCERFQCTYKNMNFLSSMSLLITASHLMSAGLLSEISNK